MKSCNQCSGELSRIEIYKVIEAVNHTGVYGTGGAGTLNPALGYCTNPACPSYAIVQVPAEDMPKENTE